MTTFLKTLPVTIVGLALLAAITVFGYTGHLNAADTYAAIMSLIGLVGATGIYVLASSWSNANALPHLVVGVGILGAVTALGLHNVFGSSQILALLALVVTGTAGGGAPSAVAALTPSPVPALPPTQPPAAGTTQSVA